MVEPLLLSGVGRGLSSLSSASNSAGVGARGRRSWTGALCGLPLGPSPTQLRRACSAASSPARWPFFSLAAPPLGPGRLDPYVCLLARVACTRFTASLHRPRFFEDISGAKSASTACISDVYKIQAGAARPRVGFPTASASLLEPPQEANEWVITSYRVTSLLKVRRL